MTDGFIVHVRPLPDRPGGPDQWQRLRGWLKVGLRAYRLRCIRIEPAGAGSRNEHADPALAGGRNSWKS